MMQLSTTASHDRDGREDTQAPLAEHLYRLPGEPWALWRWLALRSAGFPAARVLALSAPACGDAADRLLRADAAAQHARAGAQEALNQALDELRAQGAWDDLAKRQPVLRALSALRRQQGAELSNGSGAAAERLAAYHGARQEAIAARESFEQAFAAASEQCSQAVYDLTQDERFCEALIWQNRRAYHTGVKRVSDPAELSRRSSEQRQHEELVASYVQRYCVKNDTIGFFGPVGWAQISAEPGLLSVVPGAALLSARRTYFEQWGIDALARSLAERYPLWPWCMPRRLPFVYLRGQTLYLSGRRPIQLTPLQAAVLQACCGERTAQAIAHELSRSPLCAGGGAQAIYAILDDFRERDLIVWMLEVPLGTYPERSLRQLLERVDDSRVREAALAELNQLEGLKQAVSSAAGHSRQLDRALDDLETSFSAQTGVSATRAAGQTYAARTLIYEDCRRDVEVAVGADLIAALAPPLSLLLRSARWFTYEAARRYRAEFVEIYADLCRESGMKTVDVTSFLSRIQERLLGDKRGIVASIAQSFQQRWASALDLPEDRRDVAYTAVALRPRVLELFDAAGPGWRTALYHSPDVLIAAPSVEAIQRGDYRFVMGEMHIARNTLRSSLFVEQHPALEQLLRAVDLDVPEPYIAPEPPRTWHNVTARTNSRLGRPKDIRLVFSNDACGVPAHQALTLAELVVTDYGDGPVMRTRDGQRHFDLIECFGEVLGMEVGNYFQILAPARHTPRVSIDRLVICRERWCFKPAELAFAFEKRDADRFLGLWRWQRAHDLPQFTFVKLSTESKPFYVDFSSPILVNLFAKALRRAIDQGAAEELFTITEMLPQHGQMWLPDAGGQRYTSELRFVAVDSGMDK